MKNPPLVSVLMPAYNAEKYIVEAIESILNQTFTDLEFIIINDNSTDSTEKIIEAYSQKDNRIRYICNPVNLGISKTRNLLINEARGQYIAWLDSDDVAQEQRLQIQFSFLKENNYTMVGSSLVIIDKASNALGWRHYPKPYKEIKNSALLSNPFAQSTVMIESRVAKAFKYNEQLEVCEDYDLWLKIIQEHRVANMPEALTKYRITDSQSKTIKLKKTIFNTLKIKKKWLFNSGYFRLLNFSRFIAELCLLTLPNKLIIKLFKKLTYGQ